MHPIPHSDLPGPVHASWQIGAGCFVRRVKSVFASRQRDDEGVGVTVLWSGTFLGREEGGVPPREAASGSHAALAK